MGTAGFGSRTGCKESVPNENRRLDGACSLQPVVIVGAFVPAAERYFASAIAFMFFSAASNWVRRRFTSASLAA